MQENKSNQKSIRMTDTVQDYVNKQPGEGFNAKFENMVLYCMKKEPELKETLKSLDKQIQGKRDEISELNRTIIEKKNVERTLDEIKTEVDKVKILFKKLENAIKCDE